MASINGVTIKNFKQFKGHEGEPLFQGTVYLGKERLGFWSQDAHGGEDNFDFNVKKLQDAVYRVRGTFPETSFVFKNYDESLLMADICSLKTLEKSFKKAKERHFKGIACVIIPGFCMYACKESFEEEVLQIKDWDFDFWGEDIKPYEKHFFVSESSDLDLSIGTEKDAEKVSKHVQELYKQYENTVAEMKAKENAENEKIQNNGRFVFEEIENGAKYQIHDTVTDSSTIIPRNSFKEVMNVLIDLYCDKKGDM